MTLRKTLASAAAVTMVVALAACSQADKDEPSAPPADVGLNLFQWPWTAIEAECQTIADNGVTWIMTSPPQEHIQGDAWWTSYQPVSYKLESKLGTRDEFGQMVQTCGDAGVDVVADAVVNHMTGQENPGTGTGGTAYEHYDYPGIYSTDDFHHCDAANGDITNYQDRNEVQNCELVNLADLKTESEHVRTTLKAYLDDLLSLGVAGFRIDAAKHMPAEDVAAIVADLPEGTRVIQEVIRAAGEPITPEEYLEAGDVLEFSWGKDMSSLKVGSTFSAFFNAGTTSAYAPSEKSYTFVENHDTERGNRAITYKDLQYEVFTALMLASPYGTPILYSGYAFADRDAGPAKNFATGQLMDVTCTERTGPTQTYLDGEWTCQQRWPTLVNMIQWRTDAGDAAVTQEWSEEDGLSFARDGRAFIAVNRGAEPLTGTWDTTLPQGEYCDAGAGEIITTCETPTLTVGKDGALTGTIAPYSVLATSVSFRS